MWRRLLKLSISLLVKKNSLFIFRPIKNSDSHAFYGLATSAQSGLSNLPKTFADAKALISTSTHSFSDKLLDQHKQFLFVIEHNKQIVGVSGIKARTGVEHPYYSFLNCAQEKYPYLELISQRFGSSEIGSLFLAPKFRKKGIGRLLSLSRFLFVKSFPDFFTPSLIAELRGYLYKNNTSPVWNAIGKSFIPMSFKRAELECSHSKSFISTHFPKKPIYLNLISSRARAFLGCVHPLTEPAKALLLSEGFDMTQYIDILDGGPKLQAPVPLIRSIALSKEFTWHQAVSILSSGPTFLVSNQQYANFTVCKVTPKSCLSLVQATLKVLDRDRVTLVEER
jgi:arginine N-succinyltransferase